MTKKEKLLKIIEQVNEDTDVILLYGGKLEQPGLVALGCLERFIYFSQILQYRINKAIAKECELQREDTTP